MDKKYSAYICTGCGIGDGLDIEALTGVVTGEMSMECKSHEALCGAAGREMIENDINNDGVNTVVIGACSPRVMQDAFDFGDDKITIRANLREQVVWCQPEEADAEYTQELGSDYMRMG
ncbi:MAG: heterodisulfide reductase subunit A, partial [Desulfobulbaceae bacterium]|nr:heterodisulfide reductase subunit A [Desulfobulbaceae bacterium]